MKSHPAYLPSSLCNPPHTLLRAVPSGMPVRLVDSVTLAHPSAKPRAASGSCIPLASDQTPSGTPGSCAKLVLAITLSSMFDETAHLYLVSAGGAGESARL